jgi:hypothetical protein
MSALRRKRRYFIGGSETTLMGWSGRAPAPIDNLATGANDKETEKCPGAHCPLSNVLIAYRDVMRISGRGHQPKLDEIAGSSPRSRPIPDSAALQLSGRSRKKVPGTPSIRCHCVSERGRDRNVCTESTSSSRRFVRNCASSAAELEFDSHIGNLQWF